MNVFAYHFVLYLLWLRRFTNHYRLETSRRLQDNEIIIIIIIIIIIAKFGDIPDALPTKQPFCDRHGVLEDKAQVEASLVSAYQRASFSAASCQHSGDWLFSLSIASCGLKLDDEAVRVAVGLRLGLDLCIPHQCQCGSPVDARGLHSFVCRRAPGRSDRHHALNDLVARCFASAGNPVTKEPTGLFRSPHTRKEARWSSTRPMAERQVFMLGRDGHMPSGQIICHSVRPRGRCCSGTRRFS